MKKVFFIFVFLTIAVFGYQMTVESARAYIAEHQNDEIKTCDWYAAQVNVYLDENSSATYDELVNLVGKEYACQQVYQMAISSNPESQFKERTKQMFFAELQKDAPFEGTKYFDEIVIGMYYHVYKMDKSTGFYEYICNHYTKEQIREKIFNTMNNYLEIALGGFNDANINDVLNKCLKSYKAIYLDCDETEVKKNLKILNAKSYLLLDVSEDYSEFATDVRMLYKSLDF